MSYKDSCDAEALKTRVILCIHITTSLIMQFLIYMNSSYSDLCLHIYWYYIFILILVVYKIVNLVSSQTEHVIFISIVQHFKQI